MFLLSVFSGLDVYYYCSNIIVSLLSSFVPSLASDFKKKLKLWHAVQKTETFAPLQKFPKNFKEKSKLKICKTEKMQNVVDFVKNRPAGSKEFFRGTSPTQIKKLITDPRN